MRVLVPMGTRPEIVKLAPVLRALAEHGIETRTVATGQHHDPSLADSFFTDLGVRPDDRWQLPDDEAGRVGSMLSLAYRELAACRPDLVLVLGDTYTVPVFCLAARRHGVPIAHIEAGLRSFNETSMEEVDRKVAGARVIVTDSGGLQEEASWLGIPVVVLRRSTPRWEGVLAGTSVLTGLDVNLAVRAAIRQTDLSRLEQVAAAPCPYGDGHTGKR